MALVEPEQRELFFDTLYSILRETGADNIYELPANWHRRTQFVLRSFLNLEEPLRKNISLVFFLLGQAARKNLSLFRVGDSRFFGNGKRIIGKKQANLLQEQIEKEQKADALESKDI